MSATLRIYKDKTAHSVWMPSSGNFDDILYSILEQLQDQAIKDAFEENFVPGLYAFITTLSVDHFRIFQEATEAAFNKIMSHFLNTDEWLNYDMFLFAQLKALLRVDPRAKTTTQSGTIIINDGLVWVAPVWLYDLMLEGTAQYMEAIEPTRTLVEHTSRFTNKIDLSGWSDTSYCEMAKRLHWFSDYFSPIDGGRHAYSTYFNPIASKMTRELSDLTKQDPRSLRCAEVAE